MKKYKNILFDLDGTITNSGEGIVNSVIYALNKLGIAETDIKKLEKFIGPPLKDSFKEYYGMDSERQVMAVQYYREYYHVKGIYENRVYDGVKELLQKLIEDGKIVILATSKPQIYAEQIIKYFDLDKLFFYIKGSNIDGSKTDKKEIIGEIISELNLKREESLMIGDRKFDIKGAKENEIDSIGVLYGYGNREELENEKADYIVYDTEEIYKIIKG